MTIKVPYSQQHNYRKVGFNQWIHKKDKDVFNVWFPCESVEFYDDTPELTLLEKLRVIIINAIAIMNEKGKLNEGVNPRLLWLKDWEVVRSHLVDAIELIDKETTP